MPNNIGQNLVQ